MSQRTWVFSAALGATVLVSGLAASQTAARRAQPARPAAAQPARSDAVQPAAPAAAARPALTGVVRFEARPTGISRVNFVSDAPLETVEGISTQTSGTFTVDLSNPSRQLSGSIQIPTASLRTGNDLRDEHLRSANWFDAARNPNITFELVSTDITSPLTPNHPVRGNVTGRLTLHGVTREVTVPVTVRLIPYTPDMADMAQFGINTDMLRVQGEFTIRLSDYGVSIFAPLRLKVSNDIRIRVDLTTFRTG